MSARSVTLVGESNPYGADPHYALYPLPEHASGGRLARALGMSALEYLSAFERVNLLQGPKWSIPEARKRAATVLASTPKGGALVLLGARVAAAFGVPFAPVSLHVARVGEVARDALVVPHPSGLSRAWNDPLTAQKVRVAVNELRLYCALTGEP
jgi:hypothetical protein